MDPNSALQLLIDAINDFDFETACEVGNGYAAWLARGGFHANQHEVFTAFRWASELPMTITDCNGGYEYSVYNMSGTGYVSRVDALCAAHADYIDHLDCIFS
jgi:hypothetical protein